MNRLRNMRCYLGGAMEFANKCGVEWRERLISDFSGFGVVWLDPCDKPIDIGIEDIENHERRKKLKRGGNFERVAKEMRLIRCVDLRMIDLSDFLIFNIDTDVYTTGTIEELTTANRQKKPIIVRIKQGKCNCPDWILGMIPHEMIFSHWSEVIRYLKDVNEKGGNKRWFFFDFHGDKSLEPWYAEFVSWRVSLVSKEKDLASGKKELETKEGRLNLRENDLKSWEERLSTEGKRLESWNEDLDTKEKRLEDWRNRLESWNEDLDVKGKRLKSWDKGLETWNKKLNARKDDTEKKRFASWQERLESWEESLVYWEEILRKGH